MIDNAVPQQQIFNPQDENCPVCAGLDRIFRADSFQSELEIPAAIGKGYCRRIVIKPSMTISISDMTFYKKMTMGGRHDHSLYKLAFCLGEGFLCQVGNKQEYEVAGGASYMFSQDRGIGVSSCHLPGQRVLGLNIDIASELITGFLEQRGQAQARTGDWGGFHNGTISPAVRLILHEIINCRYCDQVKRIYLEGKILELIAVCLDETFLATAGPEPAARLSACDLEALRQARSILDANIAAPLTIGKLARLICLNEYKLKIGFKQLFGLPVHAYIIDKRLEAARLLMKEKKLRITEAALLVGYSDVGRFAGKFRQKYGVNPSEYLKQTRPRTDGDGTPSATE